MGTIRDCLMTVTAAFFCMTGVSVKGGTLKTALIFEADYTRSQTEYGAQKAGGEKAGILLHEAKYMVDYEPMATINHGASIGKGCASIRYQRQGNLNPGSGAVEMVVSSQDWEWNDRNVHMFMTAGGRNCSFYLYKHADDGLGVYVANGKTSTFPRSRKIMKTWKKQEKHHILVSYGSQRVRLYLDGLLSGDNSFPAEVIFGSTFDIGSSAVKWGRAVGRSTISLVACYNRSVTDQEAVDLAKSRLPGLQIQEARKLPKSKVLPASPFFKDCPREALEALSPEYVPFPWSPVKVQLPVVSVWNRSYDLSGKSVFQSVISGGRELLSSPVSFVSDGGNVLNLSVAKVLSRASGRVDIARNLLLSGMKVGVLNYRFEYDGSVFLSLQLDKNYSPENFCLRVPMKKEIAGLIHYTGTVVNSLCSIVGPNFSYSKSLDKQKGVVWSGGMHTTVWLGDNRGGLQFFTESDRGFYPKDRKDYFTVTNRDADVEFSVNYRRASFPDQAKSEQLYEFGFAATPVRPMPKHWRDFRLSAQFDSITGDARGNILVYWPDDWMWMGLDPDPVRARNKEYVGRKIVNDRKQNRKIVPYYDRHHLKHIGKSWVKPDEMLINPDVAPILDKWGMFPQRQASFSGHMVRMSTGSPWSDYLVWCLKNFDKLYGRVDGFYMDEMELAPNTNPASGGGYKAYDGTIRTTYSLKTDRDLYKRMNCVAAHGDPRAETFNIAHCSGTHMMPLVGHFSMLLVAEHLYSGYFDKDSELLPPADDSLYYYSYALPMDRVRAEFYHGQWGSAVAWLPCLKNQKDIMKKTEPTRDMLSRIMHADVLFWPLWCNAGEIHKIWKIRSRFRIGDEDMVFVPYWENRSITAAEKESAVSYYRGNDGRYMVLISNLARKGQELHLQIAPELKIRQAVNAENNQKIPLQNGRFTLQLSRNDFAVLFLNFEERK